MDLFIEQRKSIGSQAACTVLDDSPHSVAYEEYQAELAFDRRRVRRRRVLAVLRTLVLILAVPVLLVAVFIASYALMDFEDAKAFRPWIVFPDTETNRLIR